MKSPDRHSCEIRGMRLFLVIDFQIMKAREALILRSRTYLAPGKKAGDRTDFDFGIAKFPNTILKPLR